MITSLELITTIEVGLIYGIVALGIYFSFRVLDFPDLTCDGSFVCGAAASAVAIQAGLDPWTAVILSAIVGGITGGWTGMLYVCCRVTPLLSGILVAFMLYSVNLKIMGNIPNISLIDMPTIFDNYGLTILLSIALMMLLCCSYVMATDFGLSMRAIGQNKRLSIAYGIPIPAFTIIGLILSNSLIGLGGGLFSQHQGFADVSQGVGTVIVGLAAIMIGEKLVPYKRIWAGLLGCIIGSIFYRFIIALSLHSQWLGLSTSDMNLITGIIVIAIMWLPKFTIKRGSYA